MDRETELAVIRRAYAKQTLARAKVDNPQIESAYADVRREDYLGPGPWQVFDLRGAYFPTPNGDPVYLYTDDLFGIVPERQLNNGQPSLHAALIASVLPKPGEHVVHVGAGVGYYSAVMAHLVRSSGRVTAIEFEPELAARARANFAQHTNVTVVEGDGALVPFDTADVIYVNAGATAPADTWLDRLADGGRLILPLTAMHRLGGVFRIEREGDDYAAKLISPVAIFPCVGNRDAEAEKNLAAAFEKGGIQNVTRLYRGADIPDHRCWLRGRGWCLAYS